MGCFAVAFQFEELLFFGLVVGVELFDAEFGAFGFVEVFVYDCRLGFAEADEVYHVGEYFYEAFAGGFVEVVEGEVVDAALSVLLACGSLFLFGVFCRLLEIGGGGIDVLLVATSSKSQKMPSNPAYPP